MFLDRIQWYPTKYRFQNIVENCQWNPDFSKELLDTLLKTPVEMLCLLIYWKNCKFWTFFCYTHCMNKGRIRHR